MDFFDLGDTKSLKCQTIWNSKPSSKYMDTKIKVMRLLRTNDPLDIIGGGKPTCLAIIRACSPSVMFLSTYLKRS